MKKSFLPQMLITCFSLFFGIGSAFATIIPVTTVDDNIAGSLRLAIQSSSPGDTISFAGLTDGLPLSLSLGEITIDHSLTIMGNGTVNTLIDGDNLGRVFNIVDAGLVTMFDLTIMNGASLTSGGGIRIQTSEVMLDNVSISDCSAAGLLGSEGGGAIANFGGMLTIMNSTLSNNAATGLSGSGGAILNGPDGSLSIMNTEISGNAAVRAGGGIEDNSGDATLIVLTEVTFDANTAASNPGNGGAVHITGPGDIEISGGAVTNNTASAEGGGLWNGAGLMIVTDVEISGNTASGDDPDQGGGGIYNLSGTLMIDGTTSITNNTADGMAGSGGGILNDVGASLMISDATLSGNVSVRAGGAIEDNSGAATTVVITDVTFESNTTGASPGNGGAIHITGDGNIEISGGAVTDNTASAEGGGLWNGTGLMTISGVDIQGNIASGAAADQGGGGVFNAGGTIEISNQTLISGNAADGTAGSGGGIFNDAGGTLTVTNSTISANVSERAGGGIEDNSGSGTTIVLTDVTLDANSTASSPGNGGGVHITGPGDIEISGGAVTNNTASAEGGGLWNGAGLMTITEVAIDGNVATGSGADQGGGGIFNAGGTIEISASTISNNEVNGMGSGAGIHNDADGMVMLSYSTVSGNMSATSGGGITNTGSLNVNASTITANSADTDGGGFFQTDASNAAAFSSTIIAGNMANGSGQDVSGMGTITSNGYNLIGEDDGAVFTAQTTDIEGSAGDAVDANLAPLADNGGTTQTHALNCPSPAIDAGDEADNGTDQRGMDVFGDQRDIGAFEYQEACSTDATSSAIGSLSGSFVYPNPAQQGSVYIDIPEIFGNEVSIRLSELATGKLLMTQETSFGTLRLDLGKYSPGTYLIQVYAKDSVESHKLILTK
ncbi:MAG: T9SS type A sorting domain-containing protein [Bacteroidetes bacterium]|nr:T9SS type A sorting domain-containing protein [Bacteroidota bacterium]